MGQSISVTQDTFEQDILVASHDRPVVIDFFATWCGPCQLLKPMLEKLAQEYDFTLAKIDIDQEPGLAQAFGVEGVPDVRLVVEGQVRPGFVGALPEPKLREFLEQQLNLSSGLQGQLAAAQAAVAAGHYAMAKAQFDVLFEQYPDRPEVILAAVQFLLQVDELDLATRMLGTIQPGAREFYTQAEALKGLIELKRSILTPLDPETDRDRAFATAVQATLDEQYEPALSGFLAIVSQDRKYRNDGARKAMLTVFGLLGDEHELTKQYRKQLMLALY